MHRLFSITEMVATILATDRFRNELLRSCLQVNRLFSHEAVRILWHRCGTGFPDAQLGRDPTVYDLARLAAHDVSRAQYYANCIHELRFVCSDKDWPWQEGEQSYKSLTNLQFPALKSFTVGSYEITNIDSARTFNEFLFEWLEQSWPMESSLDLKTLHLMLNRSFSFDGLEKAAWFIKFAQILNSLSADLTLDMWPKAFLKSLAALPALRKLQGKKLDANILKDLPKEFPVLRELATKYTEPNFEELGKLAGLSFLTSIDITYSEGGSISGPDLLALAYGCPNLKTVNLPSASGLIVGEECPLGEGIDDTTIDKLARALPKIEVLSFGLDNRSALTHQAVISLARHCLELNHFHITANISMPDLIQGLEEASKEAGTPPLPSVTFIGFYLVENILHTYGNIPSLANRLIKLAPHLCELTITDGSEDDDKFQIQVESVAGPWRVRGTKNDDIED